MHRCNYESNRKITNNFTKSKQQSVEANIFIVKNNYNKNTLVSLKLLGNFECLNHFLIFNALYAVTSIIIL